MEPRWSLTKSWTDPQYRRWLLDDGTEAYVAPDGARLGALLRLLDAGIVTVEVGARYPLDQAPAALEHARRGSHGTTTVLHP